MVETLIKNFMKDEADRINKNILYAKQKVQKGELDKEEYKIYLRMTFQGELEFILGTKFDIEIPN